MTLFPDTTQIFTSFFDFSLSEESDSEILHDEYIIRSYGESTFEEDDSFFDISHHSIGPPEIA